MSNADDTRPSDAEEGSRRGRDHSDRPHDSTGRASGTDRETDSSESPTGETDRDEYEEIPADAIEFADEDAAGGDPSDPSDRSETMLGGFEARELDSDQPANRGNERTDHETTEPPEEEDAEVLEVDEYDDLIVEEESSEGGGEIEEGAFERAREEDDESVVFGKSDAQYDMGPTVVSDEALEPEEEGEAAPDEPDRDEPGTSGSLGRVSDEMEAAEQRGALDDLPEDELDHSTIERQDSNTADGGDRPDGPVDELGETEAGGESAPAAGGASAVGAGGRGEGQFDDSLHGETSLEADSDALADDAFEHEEYEETLIREQGLDIEESPMPEAPAAGEAAVSETGDALPEQTASPPERRGVEAKEAPSREKNDGEADAFSSQRTDLYDGDEFEGSPAVRLAVREGPEAGRECLVESSRCVVGRSSETDVVLSDDALSRRHFEIVRQPDGSFTLRDLESANGTALNGTPVEESELSDGDRIQAGQTEVQFTVPGRSGEQPDRAPQRREGARTPEPTGRPSREKQTDPAVDRRWTTALNTVIVVSVALILPLATAFVYLLATGPSAPTEAELRDMSAARDAYVAGVEAEQSENWERAAKQFERARELHPELSGLDERLERAETEKKAKEKLESARSAAREGEIERAIERAEAVPDESSYSQEAAQLLRQMRRERRLESLQKRAEQKLDAGSPEAALEVVEKMLRVAPNHSAALGLRASIASAHDLRNSDALGADGQKKESSNREGEREGDGDGESSDARAAASNRGGGSDSDWLLDSKGDDETASDDSEPSSGGGAGEIDFQRGYALYNQGRLEAAAAHFEEAAEGPSGAVSTRARRLAKKIRNFKRVYRAAERNLESGNWARASQKFRKALNVDKSVASAQYFNSKIKSRLAEAKIGEGEQHARNGRYEKAFEAYQRARQYDSSHSGLRSLLRKLEKKADSLYIQAKAKRKTSPERAAALCRSILSMVPKGNKYHQKARSLLDEL